MQDVILKNIENRLIAKISCELDHHTAKSVREQIDERLIEERPRELVLDFSGVPFMDSSGIGLILGRVDKCEGIGAKIRLTGLSGIIEKLIRISGVARLESITVD